MTKSFQPNPRLLQLLIGSNLYASPEACIRELIQNSWDAIQLRKHAGDGKGGSIQVSYSTKGRWFEITDDGFGMDLHAIENSFLEIGQNKLDVLEQGSRDIQVGYFGIGILSVFLVADKFRVSTRALDEKNGGFTFEITSVEDPLVFSNDVPTRVGTSIRVFLKSESPLDPDSIPLYVSNYVRHVDGIKILSIDDGAEHALRSRWVTDELSDVHAHNVRETVHMPELRNSRFAVHPALKSDTGTLCNEITICNAGFLAESSVHDLLPHPTVGMFGEIDLAPNVLTIGMSRERIQRDENWARIGKMLQDLFISFAIDELNRGHLQASNDLDSPEVKRNLLLWYHYLPKEEPFGGLHTIIESRVFETVPFTIAERSDSSLARILSKAPKSSKLFFRDTSRRSQRTEHIDDEGLPIRISQEIQDSVSVGALRANGYSIVELGAIQVNLHTGNTTNSYQVYEHELVRKCLSGKGVQLSNISEATEAEMDLRTIERLPMLNDAFHSERRFRFASIPDSNRRTITDSTGTKYLNVRNDEIRDILPVIPQAISNPLKSRLLDAYLSIANFEFYEARQILRELLMSGDLSSLANADTAPFTAELFRALIEDIVREQQ